MLSLQTTYTMLNGQTIPCIGFGTWKAETGQMTVDAVSQAIRAGYRLIDAATVYRNEASVGEGIRLGCMENCLRREDILVASKVWYTERGYESTLRAVDRTLNDMKLDYLDFFLIHWPASASKYPDWKEINLATWRALEKLIKEGTLKAAGLSNFMPHHIQPLLDEAEILPVVDQIEYHPGYLQQACVDYCQEHGIIVQAWRPLGQGNVLADPGLVEIAARYGKSTAQICLRWELQKGIVPLPKSVSEARIRQNTEIFDFVISEEDMASIDRTPLLGWSGQHPDTFEK